MVVEGGLLSEEGEDAAAAAAHGGIGGAHGIELGFYLAYLGMQGEDAFFEVVDQRVAPCVDGLRHDVATASMGAAGRDEREGLTSGHRDIGLDDGYMPTAEVEVDGGQLLSHSLGVCRAAVQEEGTVGAERQGFGGHLFGGHAEGEGVVEQAYHIGGIAGASAHASLCGDVFVEAHIDGGQRVALCETLVCSDHEVVLWVALDGDVCDLDVAGMGRWLSAGCLQCYLEGVCKGDGIEDCFEIVIAVGTTLNDVEPKVDFCYGKNEH